MKFITFSSLLAVALLAEIASADYPVQLGPRPYWLIDQMRDGELKDTLRKWRLCWRIPCVLVSMQIIFNLHGFVRLFDCCSFLHRGMRRGNYGILGVRFFDRPSWCVLAIPWTHFGELQSCCDPRGGNHRVRCHLHEGSSIDLPSCAVRFAHDDECRDYSWIECQVHDSMETQSRRIPALLR